jgi:hypothetical protein
LFIFQAGTLTSDTDCWKQRYAHTPLVPNSHLPPALASLQYAPCVTHIISGASAAMASTRLASQRASGMAGRMANLSVPPEESRTCGLRISG